MWTIFKVFIEFVTILSLFCLGLLTSRNVGYQFPNQGWNPHILNLEDKVPTAGLTGKSLHSFSWLNNTPLHGQTTF